MHHQERRPAGRLVVQQAGQWAGFGVVVIHRAIAPAGRGNRRIEGANRCWPAPQQQGLALQAAHAKGIGEGLDHQALQQPALVNPIAGSPNGLRTGREIQRAAGRDQAIEGLGLLAQQVEQHRAPERQPHPQERQGAGHGPRLRHHRQQIGVAAGRIGAGRQVPAWPGAPQIEAQHRKTGPLQAQGLAAHPLPGTAAAEAMHHHHQALSRAGGGRIMQRHEAPPPASSPRPRPRPRTRPRGDRLEINGDRFAPIGGQGQRADRVPQGL